MTEQIKSAIEHYRDVCVQMGQYPESDTYRYAELAIRSLNAWEEVIAQLKSRRDYYEKKNHTLFVETNACINIVESLLEGVTE